MDRIESTILRSLLYNDDYTRRVLPFLKEDYFEERIEKVVFTKIKEFVDKYNNLPSREALVIDLDKVTAWTQDEFDGAVTYISSLESSKDEKTDQKWLVNQTEAWCQEQAVHKAVLDVIHILDDKSNKQAKGNIPKLLQDALAVSFDSHVGHDYLDDAENRFDFYHRIEKRIPFHLSWFNKITKNGVPPKTLNIILAGTNVGKSLLLCDFTAAYLRQGKNVLYITMEMAEERIAERIDANLLDVPLDGLKQLKKNTYIGRIDKIKAATQGKLIIKEYPTACAHVGHFRHLIHELSLKKKFVPDVVVIDYLNICASSRLKSGSNLYENAKAIAEELRGFAVELNVPIWTATQSNRAGYNNNDLDLSNTSESAGVPATADFMFGVMRDDTLDQMNQLLIKVLKNRYADTAYNKKFLIGVDRSRMKCYDLDESAQQGLSDSNHKAPDVAAPSSNTEESDDDFLPFHSNMIEKPKTNTIRHEKSADFGVSSFSAFKSKGKQKVLKV